MTGTEETSRSRLMNANRSESRAKVHSPDGRVGRLKKGSTALEVPRPQAFIGVCRHGVVSPGELA
jgi:hypothetical protein